MLTLFMNIQTQVIYQFFYNIKLKQYNNNVNINNGIKQSNACQKKLKSREILLIKFFKMLENLEGFKLVFSYDPQ